VRLFRSCPDHLTPRGKMNYRSAIQQATTRAAVEPKMVLAFI
jgi:hypothetical protein